MRFKIKSEINVKKEIKIEKRENVKKRKENYLKLSLMKLEITTYNFLILNNFL